MTIAIIGEALGEQEEAAQHPFCGASGIELLRMLHEAGIIVLTGEDRDLIRRFWEERKPELTAMVWKLHPEVFPTNVFNFRPLGNKIELVCGPKEVALEGYPALVKGRYVRHDYAGELQRLSSELVQFNPNLVLCLGNTALWAMCGTPSIGKLRGTTHYSTHCVAGFKVLPAYHPAAVLREWSLRPVTVLDLKKAKRESAFPEIRRPRREIWIEPTLEDIDDFVSLHIKPANGSGWTAVDIETSGNQITCIGFGTRRSSIVIPFVDPSRVGRSYWPSRDAERQAVARVEHVLQDEEIKKVFQNGAYDIAFIWRSWGVRTLGAEHDTMLLHHALQPESLKGLGFLGSVYCNEGAWKQMRTEYDTIKRDD